MWLDIVGEHVWQSLGLEQHGSATIPVSAGVVICLSCMPILYRFGQLSRNMYIRYYWIIWVEIELKICGWGQTKEPAWNYSMENEPYM